MGGGYSGTLALIPYLATQRARVGVEAMQPSASNASPLYIPSKPKIPILVRASVADMQDGTSHHYFGKNKPA